MTYLIIVILALLFGGVVVYLLMTHKSKSQIKKEASILYNGIQTVFKLVSIESDFTEVLDHHDKKNVFFDLIPQNKRALLIIQAKVMVGMDLTKTVIDVDKDNKRMTVSYLPEPEILSIEMDIKYYDIQKSPLNNFSPDDFTELNKEAKAKIRDNVNNSELLNIAKRKGLETMKVIQAITNAVGWQLTIHEEQEEQKRLQN